MTTGVICTPPILQFTLNNGQLAAGGSILTQVGGVNTATYADSGLTTPLPNPIPLNSRGEISNATGVSSQLFLTPNIVYTFTLFDGPNGTGNQVWGATYVNGVQLTGTVAAGILNPITNVAILNSLLQTAAEISAGVTPTNYAYAPGDLRRYASFVTGGGDVTSALQSACAQAQKTGGSAVYIPGAMGALTVTAGVPTITSAIKIYGDASGNSTISTANDITLFPVSLGGGAIPGCVFQDFNLVGKGAGATNPCILITNTPYNKLFRMRVHSFGVGVRYAPGGNSSYLNSIISSDISQNISINIDAQALTNALRLIDVTFGGGNSATGLKVVDSANLLVSGFDFEGCTTVGIDIDNPTIPNLGGHEIVGGQIEGATSTFSAGAIRLGASNVNPVIGVRIAGIMSASGGTDDSLLNVVNCNGVELENVFLNSGFAGSGLTDSCIRIGTNAKNVSWKNIQTAAGTLAGGSTSFGLLADGQSPITGAAVVTANGGLIATANLTVSRVAPAGNITGVVLQSGTRPGQRAVVINESAFTITFAVAGTSAVADGTLDQILSNTAREFTWDTVTSLWYRKG